MHGRAPAARDAEQVAIQRLAAAPAGNGLQPHDVGAGDTAAAARRDHDMAEAARDAVLPRSLRQIAGTFRTDIDDGDDLDAGAPEIERCRVSRIVVRGD